MTTNKIDAILEYIRNQDAEHVPSVREIADVIEVSVQTARHMLTVLKDRGYITWEPRK